MTQNLRSKLAAFAHQSHRTHLVCLYLLINCLNRPKIAEFTVAVMPDETKNANQNRKLVHQQHATTASNTAAISDSQSGQSLTTSLASYDEVAEYVLNN